MTQQGLSLDTARTTAESLQPLSHFGMAGGARFLHSPAMGSNQTCPQSRGAERAECSCVGACGKPDRFCSLCKGTGKVTCPSRYGRGTVYIGNRP